MTSTQTWADASDLLCGAVLEDTLNLYVPGETETVGFEAHRDLVPLANGIPGLVQTMALPSAEEGISQSTYSIKVEPATALQAGMVVEVDQCEREPSLTGKRLLVESVSENGLALLRKAIAHDWTSVDPQAGMDNTDVVTPSVLAAHPDWADNTGAHGEWSS